MRTKYKQEGKPDVNLLEQYINAPVQSERRAKRLADTIKANNRKEKVNMKKSVGVLKGR